MKHSIAWEKLKRGDRIYLHADFIGSRTTSCTVWGEFDEKTDTIVVEILGSRHVIKTKGWTSYSRPATYTFDYAFYWKQWLCAK